MKEKRKWLAALALCMGCLVLCASLMAAPTYAEEAPASSYAAVITYKNVYERLDAQSKSKSPREFIYASSATPAKVYNAVLKEDAGVFSLGIDGYAAAAGGTEVHYFPLKTDGTLNTKKPTSTTGALTTLKAVPSRTNLYEVCDAAGVSLATKEYVYANSANPDDELALPALAKGSKFYLRLANNIYIAAAADGTLDCNDVISAGADKTFGNADDTVLFPVPEPPAPVYKYEAVKDYKNLFELLGADGKSKTPKEFLYSATTPADGSAPPAKSQKALLKGDVYYVSILDDSGIFLAVNKDGTLDLNNALWWGTDKEFGTKDDLSTAVKEDNGYFYWEQTKGVWQMIQGIFNPANTTTTTTTSSTSTTAAVYKYAAVTSHKNLYECLGADGKSQNPKQYLFSETVPTDGVAPSAAARPAFVKGDLYYVSLVADSGIFLPLNTDGTLSYTIAIWYGADKIFGTNDDFSTSVKEISGEYFWQQADGLWKQITGLTPPATTATATSTDWLTTKKDTTMPKTGRENFNPALAVALALLSMAGMFCGYQAFRRRAYRAR